MIGGEGARGGGLPAWLALPAGSLAVMLGIVIALNAGRYGAPGLIVAPFLIAGGAWAVRRGFRAGRPAGG
jgi:hypothetical protein